MAYASSRSMVSAARRSVAGARCANSESATFLAARALVATGGRLVVQSTPADESGDFHAIVTGDDPGWARFTVRSDDVSTISPAFVESERRALGPDAYAVEYECAFGKVGATLFSAERIALLVLPSEAT